VNFDIENPSQWPPRAYDHVSNSKPPDFIAGGSRDRQPLEANDGIREYINHQVLDVTLKGEVRHRIPPGELGPD
jgi:hypothetical protein